MMEDFFNGHHVGTELSSWTNAEDAARKHLGVSRNLWLPRRVVYQAYEAVEARKRAEIARMKAREEAERAEQEREKSPKEEAQIAEDDPDAPLKQALAYRPGTDDVKIFPDSTINAVLKSWETNADRSRKSQAYALGKKILRDNGYRKLKLVPIGEIDAVLGEVRRMFPHFKEAIAELECAWSLANSVVDEAHAVFTPLLLDGPPGVGKTLFAESLAMACGVPLESIDAASAQGSFEIVGTATHWDNTQPSRIFTALAEGPAANPLLLIDELDKASSDSRYPFADALLPILEPRTAKRFEDSCLRAPFDASKLMIVATSNDANRISQPILSRMQVVSIPAPDAAQRYEIAKMIADNEASLFAVEVAFAESAIAQLADSNVSPREMRKIALRSIAKALRSHRDTVTHVEIGPRETRQKVGFV